MTTHRLAFSKLDTARFISHLDLMRTFQRAFLRAGIPIKHTEGFNPHAFVSIPLPLSVGYSSTCEVLECQILGEDPDLDAVPERMNAVLPAGIRVERCYVAERPVKQIAYVNYIVTLEYEGGAPFGADTAIQELLARESLIMQKRSKKAKSGFTEVDLIPLIAKSTVEERRDTVTLDLVVRAKDPGLNPELILAAIRQECPQAAPDLTMFHRRAVLDQSMEPWE
ncbi:TIGR03936 family radical SAM-associated protein [Pseudoflavonifractor sp. MSJ-37]|uniref:TIGR03936 family radical SAM-associated protein n=1 Tax=Pseudoflavonifractor sp. MSJ-37 TaxID=2841531 RepID=UPI001C1008C6|nr:TIGR03936 family radical SAM-associated protein [Pseudoflavonifractor sp. MSJ-37]MBU5434341.1 TIGR03936 family radical SAM-associated protein [Pseudoflavonifractor sp. MSJ-37]